MFLAEPFAQPPEERDCGIEAGLHLGGRLPVDHFGVERRFVGEEGMPEEVRSTTAFVAGLGEGGFVFREPERELRATGSLAGFGVCLVHLLQCSWEWNACKRSREAGVKPREGWHSGLCEVAVLASGGAMTLWKLAPLALLTFALFAACGDGPDLPPPTATPTAPGNADRFGPAPVLGGNIDVLSPAHASSVPRASTAMLGQLSPKGVCAQVNFEGLPQSGQWFRMAVDGVEVTASSDVYWFLSANDAEGGTICYAPQAGLEPGLHTAALSVQDPTNPVAPARQIVGWSFEVTP